MIVINFMKKIILTLLLFTFQTTFANPFTQNFELSNDYQDIKNDKNAQFLKPNQNVRVIYLNSVVEMYDFLSEGYKIIGSSSFVSDTLPNAKAIEQATKVKAPLVLIEKTVLDQSITVNNYQKKPDINLSYNYISIFLVLDESYKKSTLGLQLNDLSDDLIQKYRRNTGVFVSLVYKNTPAYRANILRNDVITQINGREVFKENFLTVLNEEKGKKSPLKFTVLRDSDSLVIPVVLNDF